MSTLWQPVFKTEVRANNLNPTWNTFSLSATQLHNGDPDRPLLLKVCAVAARCWRVRGCLAGDAVRRAALRSVSCVRYAMRLAAGAGL